MTGHADLRAAAGGGDSGSRWSCLTAEGQAGLPAHPYAGRDPRTASRRIDPATLTTWRYQQMTTLFVASASARLDAGGTTWRLCSLIAMGHDSSRIARAMNVRPKAIQKLVRGDTTTVSPQVPGPGLPALERGGSSAARNDPQRAQGRQRSPPASRTPQLARAAGLDEDELDEPGYRPFCSYRPATGTSIAPDFRPARSPGKAREIA